LTPFAELAGTLLAAFSTAALVFETVDDVEKLVRTDEGDEGAGEEVGAMEEEDPSICRRAAAEKLPDIRFNLQLLGQLYSERRRDGR